MQTSSNKHDTILQSAERDQLLERLVECDAVVYNISEHATEEQIEEATWAVTGKALISLKNRL